MSLRFSCATPGVQQLAIILFLSEVAHLVSVECLYLNNPLGVGF